MNHEDYHGYSKIGSDGELHPVPGVPSSLYAACRKYTDTSVVFVLKATCLQELSADTYNVSLYLTFCVCVCADRQCARVQPYRPLS